MEQNEVVSISNIVYNSLNEAYFMAIVADESDIDSLGLDFYGAFFVNVAGNIIYKSSDGNGNFSRIAG